MSILKIAKIGHPVLFKKSTLVKKMPQNDLKRLVIDMSHTLIDADGMGLAAPQIYVNKRIIIFRAPSLENDEEQKINIAVLVNPSYKNDTEEFEDDWEGCLSIPGMLGKVRRYKKITYKGYNIQGKLVKKSVEGLYARVIQHECDHLDGILYTSKLVDQKSFGFADEIRSNLENEKKYIK